MKANNSGIVDDSLDKNEVDSCMIVRGNSNSKLAQKISKLLQSESFSCACRFSDREVRIKIPNSVRRKSVFIIQSTNPPAENFLELCFMIDASRRGSAEEITAVVPYFGYARQDRTANPGEPISSALVADFIQYSGADRIVTVDLHAEQLTGAVTIPLDNLYASKVLIPRLKKYLNSTKTVVVSPDKGGFLRANAYAKRLNTSGIALIFKNRDLQLNDTSDAHDMIGEVKGKTALIVDDIWSTGNTIINAVNLLKEKGAKSIVVAITHGVFAGQSLTIINDPKIKKIFVTDTIAHKRAILNHPKIEIVSIAPLLAEAIKKIQLGSPLRELFD